MIKARRPGFLPFALGIFALFGAVLGAAEAPAAPLRILTGPAGGQWEALGDELARLLSDAGIPALAEGGGGMENLRRVGDGRADIGFTFFSFLGAAAAGVQELGDSVNLDGLSLLANLYPEILYIVVRKDFAERHGVNGLGDLIRTDAPVRFATLARGSGSAFLFGMLLKSGYGTDYATLGERGWRVGFESYADLNRMFMEGGIDVFAHTGGPGTQVIPALEAEEIGGIPLQVEPEKLDMMTHQFMTIAYVIEKGEYRNVELDTTTLGDYSSLVVRADLPKDLIERINAIIWENRAALARATENINHLHPRFAVSGRSRVHPGSLAFWKSPRVADMSKP